MKKIILLSTFLIVGTIYSQALFLYGGKNHDVFLGCLNCPSYDSKSIWCAYGDYGSTYGAKSIWTSYGEFGSTYSSYSPWTTYADKPPVIIDKDGNFYGYLTINKAHAQVAKTKLTNTMYEYHDFIRKDVSGWYKKLFK